MLTIEKVLIRNFRSIDYLEVNLSPLTVLIGKNNAGKSNLLDALAMLLEGTVKSVSVNEFWDPREPFEIRAVLAGVREYLPLCDEKHRGRIEERVTGENKITIRRTGTAKPELESIEIQDPRDASFKTPTGIDAGLRRLLPEVIYIRALADVADETGKASGALPKILAQIAESIELQAKPIVEAAFEGAGRLLNVRTRDGREVDERVPELRAVEGEISSYLQEAFPRALARLKIGFPEVREILGSIEIDLLEGGTYTPYYRKGHGLQRVLYLSLVRTLANKIRQRTGQELHRPFVLLFEEPELFLHPTAQEQMRVALEQISKSQQIVVSTHSPLVLSLESCRNLLRVEKKLDTEGNREVTRLLGEPLPPEILENEKDMLALLAFQRSSRIFFYSRTILVEGASDLHLLTAMCERIAGEPPENRDSCIVEVGSKDKLLPFRQILRCLGSVVWVLSDLDFLWRGAGAVFGGDAEFSRFLQELNGAVNRDVPGNEADDDIKMRRNRRRTELCCKVEPHKGRKAALSERLRAEGICVLAEGEIESYVGVGMSAKGRYLETARAIREGRREIEHRGEVEALVRMMLS